MGVAAIGSAGVGLMQRGQPARKSQTASGDGASAARTTRPDTVSISPEARARLAASTPSLAPAPGRPDRDGDKDDIGDGAPSATAKAPAGQADRD